MTKKQAYTSDDIQVLNDRDHVRLRLPVYAGSTAATTYEIPIFSGESVSIEQVEFIPAAYKCIGEIIDNCIDELTQIDRKDKQITIDSLPISGWFFISDNGRGVPIDKHSSGVHTPQVVFSSLRSGRNFTADKQSGVIGMNGMGSSITNFCSKTFNVTIHRDKKIYNQTFENGAADISKPSIRKTTTIKTGTAIEFELDDTVFSDVCIDERLIKNRAMEVAFTNPGFTVHHNKQKFHYKNGLDDVIKTLTKKEGSYHKFEFQQDDKTLEFYVIFGAHQEVDEKVFTWVNSSLLFDGGICNTQFTNAFYDAAIKHLQPQAKKAKVELTKNDIRQSLLVFANIKVSNPEYDAQAKTRLIGPNMRIEMGKMIEDGWKTFARKNKQWLQDVLDRAVARVHDKANKAAIKQHKKANSKKVPGLVDATGKMRSKCQLLITEGLSAASMVTDVRNPQTTATFPLTGKINNVYNSTVAQVLNMGKVTNLLSAINLIPGQQANLNDLRYGKIVIATDADFDGDDIFTLLVNLFYQFWPDLFDKSHPVIHRLVAPNVCLVKGKKRVHFCNREEYEQAKAKYKGWDVRYYKGLGSMEREDWEMILNGTTDGLIPIYDDGNMKDVLKLLFSNDAEPRKDWLRNKE